MFASEGGWCVWITGLPGSGKSMVAQALLEKLKERSVHAQIVSAAVVFVAKLLQKILDALVKAFPKWITPSPLPE